MNKRTLFMVVLAGLTLALPLALRAETSRFSKIKTIHPALVLAEVESGLAQQHQKAVRSRADVRVGVTTKAIVTFGLTWRNLSDSSYKNTRCKGALLAGKNRVVTSSRCFSAEKNFGAEYELKKIVANFENGKKVVVGVKNIRQSGNFAFADISPQQTVGLAGVELKLLPGSTTFTDSFKEASPFILLSFMGDIVKADRFYRSGNFDLEKWNREAILGEPVFYQNQLIALNVVNARYHYFIKEKPLFLIFNETNGGAGLLK